MTLAVTLTVEELRTLVREESAKAGATTQAPAPEVLTRETAAKLLDVHPNVVSRYVKELGLPAIRMGGEWRFIRTEVMAWLASRERVEGKASV